MHDEIEKKLTFYFDIQGKVDESFSDMNSKERKVVKDIVLNYIKDAEIQRRLEFEYEFVKDLVTV